jgi:hypothetical protein
MVREQLHRLGMGDEDRQGVPGHQRRRGNPPDALGIDHAQVDSVVDGAEQIPTQAHGVADYWQHQLRCKGKIRGVMGQMVSHRDWQQRGGKTGENPAQWLGAPHGAPHRQRQAEIQRYRHRDHRQQADAADQLEDIDTIVAYIQ